MTVPSHRTSRSPLRRTLTAVGLGLGVTGIGLTLSDIYGRPSIGVGGVVLGVCVGVLHIPWSDFVGGSDGSSSR